MEHTHLYSFFSQRNQTVEAAPSNMRLKLDWCQDPSIGAWIHWLASWCSSQWYRDARLWDPRWRVTTHPEANQGVISQCSYSRIFITKTSALSHFTCRSETEEAEDADEDRCTAESDIVPALTWDGIQGLYRIHRPREWDVYNLTIPRFIQFPLSRKAPVFQKSHVDVCQFGGGSDENWWTFHEHGIL